MSEFKGTKGEWTVDLFLYTKDCGYIPIQSTEKNRHWIAEVKGRHVNPNITQEEMMANAQLVAAAPDMLEALKSIVDYWNSPVDGSLYDHIRHSLDLAEKTINKALGK